MKHELHEWIDDQHFIYVVGETDPKSFLWVLLMQSLHPVGELFIKSSLNIGRKKKKKCDSIDMGCCFNHFLAIKTKCFS